MRPVHIVGFAQLPHVLEDARVDEAEMVQRVTAAALADAGLGRKEVGFTCSGSNDYVMGKPFSFAMALDGLGAWPPIRESHVEMDGAWAMYEAFVRLQHGDVDVALAYSFGKSTVGSVDAAHTLELDPYTLAPTGVDPLTLAAIQARRALECGEATEQEWAQAVADARVAGNDNPLTPNGTGVTVDELLAAPYVRDPLRAHDGPIRTDGAAAVVLAVGGGGPRIRGLAHCIDKHQPGFRDLARCDSAKAALVAAGGAGGVEVAELHALYSPQIGILQRALGLRSARINPSGGPLVADTPMVSGLVRVGEALNAVRGGAQAALAHASSGPCLQHNLICVLESA
jgi:acetyl-CoA acetyltransferase